jgi:hypothetical protein
MSVICDRSQKKDKKACPRIHVSLAVHTHVKLPIEVKIQALAVSNHSRLDSFCFDLLHAMSGPHTLLCTRRGERPPHFGNAMSCCRRVRSKINERLLSAFMRDGFSLFLSFDLDVHDSCDALSGFTLRFFSSNRL